MRQSHDQRLTYVDARVSLMVNDFFRGIFAMFRHLIFVSSLLAAGSAFAADLGKKPGAPAAPVVSASCKETKGLPADVFGFATGSDVADLGAWGIALDAAATKGVRGGAGTFVTPVLQVSGSFFPCLEIGPYAFLIASNFDPYGPARGTSGSAFGGGLEVKYKLLGRATHGVGLTLAVNPNAGGYSGSFYGTGPTSSGTPFNNSFRLLADVQLASRLYGAVNVELFQNTIADNPLKNLSTFAVRGALSYALTDSFYLGAEVSHQRGYEGTWLKRYVANATYAGPTFFWALNDKFTLNGTVAFQVAGSDKYAPGRGLGIGFFPRTQGRLKLAYAF